MGAGTRLPYRLALLGSDSGAASTPPDEEELVAFRRAAWLHPEEGDYHFILGEALLRAGRHQEAAVAFEEATWRHAGQAQYQHALGVALSALSRHGEAASAFREAVRLAPNEAGSHVALGVALMHLRQSGEAIRSLRRAVRLAPSSFDAHFDLGLALLETGRPMEALAPLRRAADLAPQDPTVHGQLGAAALEAGSDAEARSALSRALHLDPGYLGGRPQLRAAFEAAKAVALREDVRTGGDSGRLRWLHRALHVAVGLAHALHTLPQRLAALAAVVLLAGGAYAGSRVASTYMTHYAIKDDVAEIAHAPIRDDAAIRQRLMSVVRRRRLDAFIAEDQFTVDTGPQWRRITCEYRRPIHLFPGLVHMVRFRIDVEKPVLIPGEDVIFF
jgi:Flp pilus assembly protein TadD